MDHIEEDNDNRPFSHVITKRPNKGLSHNRYRNIQLNKTTGISKSDDKSKPANQLKNPTWDHELRQWTEGIPPPEYKKEPKHPFTSTTEITGRVKDDFLLSRRVSESRITPWRKVYVGPPNKSLPYWKQSRQPSHSRQSSHSRQLGEGGRRSTHKHKRKNKHTRRRRVQRRRA